MIIWLASYPKSGNTWVRSFLSSYYFSKDGNFTFDLLNNIDQYPNKKYFGKTLSSPGEINQYWEESQENIIKDGKPKILKTHNSFVPINNNYFTSNKFTLGVIYIVRDPRNIITSLKNHYELNYKQALEFMTKEKKYIFDNRDDNINYANFHFLSSWSNHYHSWNNAKLSNKILIKYEDIEKDSYKTFENLIKYMNNLYKVKTKIDKEKIKKCIETTSFDVLKEKEKKIGFPESVFSSKSKSKIDFFNLGSKNQWQKVIPKNFHENINKTFNKDLKKLGYR